MTKLAYLHEPGVLYNLSCRYSLNEIYVSQYFSVDGELHKDYLQKTSLIDVKISTISQTYTGNILIAVNPFRRLPHLYDIHMMQQYKGTPFGELSPHLFAVADACYR